MNKNLNLKNLNLKKFVKQIGREKSSWQKGVLFAAIIVFVALLAACVQLVFKPLNQEIKGIVEEEVSSTNIIFDKKTLDDIKKRYQPQSTINPTGSKDPFAQF